VKNEMSMIAFLKIVLLISFLQISFIGNAEEHGHLVYHVTDSVHHEVSVSSTKKGSSYINKISSFSSFQNYVIETELVSDIEVEFICIPEFVSIASEIYRVVEIEDFAFKKNEFLKRIEMPSSIRKIGKCAFLDCRQLQSFKALDSLRVIRSSAFLNCSNLKTVTFNASLDSVCYFAFRDCHLLKTVTIPKAVRFIDEEAFSSCISLETVDWLCAAGIRHGTFENCKKLKSFRISDGCDTLVLDAFAGCSELEKLFIPKGIKYVDGFLNTNYLTLEFKSFKVDRKNEFYSSEDGVLFNKQKSTLIYYPSQKRTAYYKMPDGVKTVKSYIFYSHYLESFEFSNSLDFFLLGYWVCNRLNTITIKNADVFIPETSFYSLKKLKKIKAPKEFWNRSDLSAFRRCSSLKLPDEYLITDFKRSVFSESYKDFADSVFIVKERKEPYKDGYFGGLRNMKRIVFPKKTKVSLCDGAFLRCDSFKTFIVPAGMNFNGWIQADNATSFKSKFVNCLNFCKGVIYPNLFLGLEFKMF